MNPPVATPSTAAYRLTEDLQEPVRSEAVRHAVPGEAEFEDLLLRKLGARGWGRVHHFRNYYGPGWGGKTGQPLSPRAVEAFRRFLQDAAFPQGQVPSVFLTDRGGLELCWEDTNRSAIQVEFTSQGVEFYQAATEAEGFVDFGAVSRLARRLAAT